MIPATFDPEKERAFLDELVGEYRDASPYSAIKKEIIADLMDPFLQRERLRVMQMGCASGYETELLASRVERLDVVDGSRRFVELVRQANTRENVRFVCSLFEELDRAQQGPYDVIVCSYVLEHVADPVMVLGKMRELVAAGGVVLLTVPNSGALSRRIALAMGLIESLDGLTENDYRHGHRRTYDLARLRADVARAGFEVVETRGIVVKILADFQLNALLADGFLTRDHIRALQALAQGPEIELADSFFLAVRPAR